MVPVDGLQVLEVKNGDTLPRPRDGVLVGDALCRPSSTNNPPASVLFPPSESTFGDAATLVLESTALLHFFFWFWFCFWFAFVVQFFFILHFSILVFLLLFHHGEIVKATRSRQKGWWWW